MDFNHSNRLWKFCAATFVGSLIAATYCGPLVLVAWLLSTWWLNGINHRLAGHRTAHPRSRRIRR